MVRINRIVNIVAEHLDVLEIVRSQALLCSHIKVIVTIDEWRGGIEGLGIKAHTLAADSICGNRFYRRNKKPRLDKGNTVNPWTLTFVNGPDPVPVSGRGWQA